MKKIFLIISFNLVSLLMFSQGSQNNWWHFGNNSSINFNTSPPTVGVSNIDTHEGTSAISDSFGNLLFYTDGVKIYKPDGQIMSDAANNTNYFMSGNYSSTQSALIVPVPGNFIGDITSKYYVFTIAELATEKVKYSIVDMNVNNGTVTNINTNLPNAMNFLNNDCEKILVIGDCNGIDYWLITHEYGNNRFKAYKISSSGISSPVISETGMNYSEPVIFSNPVNATSIGQLKASSDGTMIASAINLRGVELYDFDKTSGIITLKENIVNSIIVGGIPVGESYGVEFSSNNQYLYYTTDVDQFGVIGRGVFSYNIATPSVPSIKISNSGVHYYRALQIAPDGNIYVARVDNYLGIISDIDNGGVYNHYGLELAPGTGSKIGLPIFAPELTSIQIELPSTIFVCDSFEEICGPNSSNNNSFSYEWYGPGHDPTEILLLGEEMCFTPTQTGNYSLIITDENGCTASHTINITDTIPQPDLGIVDCEQAPFGNINILNQDFDNPDYTITWYHNGQIVQVGGETLMMSIEQGEVTVTVAVDDCEPGSDTIEIYCCPDDLEIVMNCETGLLEVQNLPSNITINTMFWDYDFQTLPNSNSTTYQPTQEGVYSFGIIFTFPNGEECHHFIHYDYKEAYCCDIIGSQANVSLQNPNNNFHYVSDTKYGPMEIPAMCERVVLDGSLSTCEDGYFISIAAFDPVSWTDDPAVSPNPIYQGWTQGQAPNYIDLTQPPFNITFTNQTYYMIQFAVGPNWDDEYILFWYDCDAKREMVVSPNPTQGEFTVSMSNNEKEGALEILDLSGNSVFRGTVSGGKPSQVNISKAKSGVYFVRVYIEGETYTKKILKN